MKDKFFLRILLEEDKQYNTPKRKLQKIRERVREAKAKNQQVSENSLNEL